MDLDDLHLYDGRSSRSSRGERAEKEKRKRKMATIHHAAKKEKKKREDGPQPPLEVGSKMECAGPKVDQRAPPYQMVVVTSRLSFAGIFSCIFSPRFVTLKETFPSSSFGALRDDYTAGFIFYFFF
jgi:hypothetical protein